MRLQGWGPKPIGLVSLYKEEETPESSLLHAHRGKAAWELDEKVTICKAGRALTTHQIYQHLDHGLQSPEMWENKFQVFKAPNLWYFVTQPKQTNTVTNKVVSRIQCVMGCCIWGTLFLAQTEAAFISLLYWPFHRESLNSCNKKERIPERWNHSYQSDISAFLPYFFL